MLQAQLEANRGTLTAVRQHMNIAELTRSMLSENRTKECPELSEMRRRFDKHARQLEDECDALRAALDAEVEAHHAAINSNNDLKVRREQDTHVSICSRNESFLMQLRSFTLPCPPRFLFPSRNRARSTA